MNVTRLGFQDKGSPPRAKVSLSELKCLVWLSIPRQSYSYTHANLLDMIEKLVVRDELVPFLLEHRIVYSALQNVSHMELPVLEKIIDVLKAHTYNSTLRQMALKGLEISLLQELSNAQISVHVVKGFSLSKAYYPSEFFRELRDIDIWVPTEDLREVHKILENNAVKLYFPPTLDDYFNLSARYKDLSYYKASSQSIVEVHTRMIAAKTKFCVHLNNILSERRLTPDEEFVYLCVHGQVSCFHRLKWLTDVYLISQTTSFCIEQVLKVAKQYGCERYVFAALLLIRKLYPNLPRYNSSLRQTLASKCCVNIVSIMCLHVMKHRGTPARKLRVFGYVSTLLLSNNWQDYRSIITNAFTLTHEERKAFLTERRVNFGLSKLAFYQVRISRIISSLRKIL